MGSVIGSKVVVSLVITTAAPGLGSTPPGCGNGRGSGPPRGPAKASSARLSITRRTQPLIGWGIVSLIRTMTRPRGVALDLRSILVWTDRRLTGRG